MPKLPTCILATFVALSGCHAITEPLANRDITLAVSRTQATHATPIEITVTFVNRSDSVLVSPDPRDYLCRPPYFVRDAYGDEVPLPGRFCLAIAYPPRRLAPGDSLVLHDRWSL